MKKLAALILLAVTALPVFTQSSITADDLKKHVFYLASDEMAGRGWATAEGMLAGDYIAAQFEQAGLSKIGDSYFHPFMSRTGSTVLMGRNVVGFIQGSDPELKKEFIVIGGHYDHVAYKFEGGEKVIFNGADDNASGTATVIELAKALQKADLKRSVILVGFDAEESGLIGSTELVRQEFVPLNQIKAMFSIDMVGRYAESKSLIMGALDDVTEASAVLLELAEKREIKIKKTGGDTMSRTDTKPFGDAGIPAIYVSTGIVGPYHKPEDDPETLDYDGMAAIANLLTELTVAMANMNQLEPSAVLAAPVKNGVPLFRLGAVASLGSSHHKYPDQFYQGKSIFSMDAGFMTQLNISKNFALQPELLYEMMGSKVTSGYFVTHSLTTPVNLVLASNMNSMADQRFFAMAGGYYTWHFAGSEGGQAVDFDQVYHSRGYGITWGIGLEAMSVYAKLTFKYGLNNLLIDESAGLMKDRGAYLTLGYFF